jgi:hypothetical protein
VLTIPASAMNVLTRAGLSVAPGCGLIVNNGNIAAITDAIRSGRLFGKLAPYTGLAAVLNDKGDGQGRIRDRFGGQDVALSDVLVKHTWHGDANLDGVVNADDYFQIDSGFISQKGGYYNGDFNYDGGVNADDYFLIDSAFIGQSGPLMASQPSRPESVDVIVLRQPERKHAADSVLSQLFSTELVL